MVMLSPPAAAALRPAASANAEVVAIARRLITEAQAVQDPQARTAMLVAAEDLLNATSRITEALDRTASGR